MLRMVRGFGDRLLLLLVLESMAPVPLEDHLMRLGLEKEFMHTVQAASAFTAKVPLQEDHLSQPVLGLEYMQRQALDMPVTLMEKFMQRPQMALLFMDLAIMT